MFIFRKSIFGYELEQSPTKMCTNILNYFTILLNYFTLHIEGLAYFKSKWYDVSIEGFCCRLFPSYFIFTFHIFLNNFLTNSVIYIQELVMGFRSLLIEGLIYAMVYKYCYYCNQICQYAEILRGSIITTYMEK